MTTTTLRELLFDSRDGEWGQGDPGEGRVKMHAIRGTDFPDIREGNFDAVPVRYLETRHADRKRLQLNDILLETAGGTAGRPTGRTALITRRVLDLVKTLHALVSPAFSE
jgi:type I restriction enzyme, S subunit